MCDNASLAKALAIAGGAGGTGGDTGIADGTTTTTGLGAAGGALREHALSSTARITQDAVRTCIVFAPGWIVALCLRI
jgi:hypothetical protein